MKNSEGKKLQFFDKHKANNGYELFKIPPEAAIKFEHSLYKAKVYCFRG